MSRRQESLGRVEFCTDVKLRAVLIEVCELLELDRKLSVNDSRKKQDRISETH
jgi:hypothetical protein